MFGVYCKGGIFIIIIVIININSLFIYELYSQLNHWNSLNSICNNCHPVINSRIGIVTEMYIAILRANTVLEFAYIV